MHIMPVACLLGTALTLRIFMQAPAPDPAS
jgi:hypothetical protein